MNNINSRPMTDKELMKLAKTRVMLRSLFKWICTAFFIVNVFLVAIWFFLTGRGYFWPGWVMAGWGVAITILGIIIKSMFLDTNDKVNDEYNRLKQTAVMEGNNKRQ